jgi:hypothetical protein
MDSNLELLFEKINKIIIKLNNNIDKIDDIIYNTEYTNHLEILYSLNNIENIVIKVNNILNNIDQLLDVSNEKITKYLSNKRQKISKCPGCYPIFQENQEAHYNGCLKEYD